MSGQITKEFILWGATGQAKVLRECLRDSVSQLVAIFDSDESLSSPFADVPIYYGTRGFERWLASRSFGGPVSFLVAIGGEKGKVRVEVHEYLETQGLVPMIARHSTAFVADNASIGEGSQILAQS